MANDHFPSSHGYAFPDITITCISELQSPYRGQLYSKVAVSKFQHLEEVSFNFK
jgi:hypothetical protein